MRYRFSKFNHSPRRQSFSTPVIRTFRSRLWRFSPLLIPTLQYRVVCPHQRPARSSSKRTSAACPTKADSYSRSISAATAAARPARSSLTQAGT